MSIIGVLFDTTGSPARWYCGRWSELHGWPHIGADRALFGAYAAIPVALVCSVRKRRNLPFPPIRGAFPAHDLPPRNELDREPVSAALPELRPA